MNAPPPSLSRPTLAVYDFDGTLSHYDSFMAFLWFAFGPTRYLWKLLKLIAPSLAYVFHLMSRDRLKEKLIGAFLKDVEVKWLEAKSEAYCSKHWEKLMRKPALESVSQSKREGAVVTICSASPSITLKPFAQRLNIGLIATELEVINERLSGRILGKNCRCEQKVMRLQAVYGDLANYHFKAWGDSDGDMPMLAKADESFWRPFNQLGHGKD